MLERIKCHNRAEWLAQRQRQGIGGSDAAAIVGMSPWQSAVDLWKVKTGIVKPKDLSGNAAVERGNTMEPILRDFYMATHPEYRLKYHPFDILYQIENPWLFATLDGELFDRDEKRGILEIKTGSPKGKAGWDEWSNGKLPENYFIQCCHQLLATGYDFVRLFACLYSMDGTMTLKEYEIEEPDVREDMKWLLAEETRFWNHYVLAGRMPPQPLRL